MGAEAPIPADAETDETATARDERVFLVVVDNSEEMRVALHFACRRARRTGGRIALLHVMDRADFQHWAAVGDLMRQEAREEGEQLLQSLSAEVLEWSGSYPVLYIREGDVREELVNLIEEEPTISILVLAASTGQAGPGPIISYLLGKKARQNRLPVTIVPGNLSDEEILEIT